MNIKKLMEKISEDDINIKIKETPYIFNGTNVPRVTNIISEMLHEEYLMGWSNYLGFKRQKYKEVLDIAANKGTYTHDYIEEYIKNNIEPDIDQIPIQYHNDVKNAFASFKLWWDDLISNNKVEIIYQEIPLVCKWFGGKLDILLKINDRYYLLDFKTSNHPSYKHFLQLSAYIDMLYDIHNIKVDGCGTIMLSKTSHQYTQILMDMDYSEDILFMNECKETFYALVYAYYCKTNIDNKFKDIVKKVV